jgi:hypothetical protein
MPTMETIDHSYHYSLFKGDPGTRKSTQALTYPKPIYWFDFDDKIKAMALPMKHFGINGKDIHYDRYAGDDMWARARAKLESFQVSCPYKTIVIDSITSLADKVLRNVVKSKTGQTRASGASAGKRIGGIPVNELEDFNAEAATLTEMVDLTKDICNYHKVDVILIGHVIATEEKNIGGLATISRILVTAAKRNGAKIPAYCDETYQFGLEPAMEVGKAGDFNILTSHSGTDFARTSLPLPAKIIIRNGNLYEEYIKPAIKKISEKAA